MKQQRVGIARAVVNRPPLLLADEPTGNLDPDLSKDIMKVFEAFNQVGVSVLIASHDLSLISPDALPDPDFKKWPHDQRWLNVLWSRRMSILFQGRATGATAVKQSLWYKFVMFWIHHLRQALTSLGEIWLTPASSLLTVAVLGVSLTLPVTLHLMVKNLQQVSTSVDQAAQISLFLKADTNETQIAELIALLQANPEVADVQFIDKSQALAEFTAESGFGDALSYIEDNPLPHVMLVSPRNTSRWQLQLY